MICSMILTTFRQLLDQVSGIEKKRLESDLAEVGLFDAHGAARGEDADSARHRRLALLLL